MSELERQLLFELDDAGAIDFPALCRFLSGSPLYSLCEIFSNRLDLWNQRRDFFSNSHPNDAQFDCRVPVN